MCFDRSEVRPYPADLTVVQTMFCLFDGMRRQIAWYHPGTQARTPSGTGQRRGLRRRQASVDGARATVIDAYEFLLGCWRPDDRIFLFGAGRGGSCAQALTRLLGTVGMLPRRSDRLLDYALATYAVPRTERSAQDWQRVTRLAAQLTGHRDIAVPVRFLGLWDAVPPPGLMPAAEPLTNVLAGRHARAIDGGPLGAHGSASKRIEEVWFRGSPGDLAGLTARRALADTAVDWIVDGAVAAGAMLDDDRRCRAPRPTESSVLAGTSRTLSLRRLPPNATVHASVDVYLRAHPRYWRRLPSRVVWADRDWLARGERLVPLCDRPARAVVVAPQLLSAAS